MFSTLRNSRGNNAMVNHLISEGRIRTYEVECVFRAVDRGEYVAPEDRNQAYRQQPWRRGVLHLSAPCIYGEALELLALTPGLSFLNIGSGTGYFSTLVGLIIGCSGVNHGVEIDPYIVVYAKERLEHFIETTPALDEFDFCSPKFYNGNGLCLGPHQKLYDRVYCGAQCPVEYLNYMKQLIKIGGILVLPVENRYFRIKRTSLDTWSTQCKLHVAFVNLQLPTKDTTRFTLEFPCPQRLQILSYTVVRNCMRASQISRRPRVYEPLLRCPRLTDVDVNKLLRHILSMNKIQGIGAQPLTKASSETEENSYVQNNDFLTSPVKFDRLENPHHNNMFKFTVTPNQSDQFDQPHRSDQSDKSNQAVGPEESIKLNQSEKSNQSESRTLSKQRHFGLGQLTLPIHCTTTDSQKHTPNADATLLNSADKSDIQQKSKINEELEINGEFANKITGDSTRSPICKKSHTTTTEPEGEKKKSKDAADPSKEKPASSTDANKESAKKNEIRSNIFVFGDSKPSLSYFPKLKMSEILANKESASSSMQIPTSNSPQFGITTPKSGEETNRFGLTLRNTADASYSKEKSVDGTETKKEPLSHSGILQLFPNSSFITTHSGEEAKKNDLTLQVTANASNSTEISASTTETNNEPEKTNKASVNKWRQLDISTDFMSQEDRTSKSHANNCDDKVKSDNITEFNKVSIERNEVSVLKTSLSQSKDVMEISRENLGKNSGSNDVTVEIECVNKPNEENMEGGAMELPNISSRVPLQHARTHVLHSPCGRDIRLSIIVKSDVNKIHIPHQLHKSDNVEGKSVLDIEEKSSWKLSKAHNQAQSRDHTNTDVFTRLNISLPQEFSSAPLAKEIPIANVTVSFRTLCMYTDRIWDTMQAIGTYPFNKIDNEENKAVFQKGALLLAEAKVIYAQRNSSATSAPQKVLSDEELLDLKQMASKLPRSLVSYLMCLGNTSYEDQVITPIFLENQVNTFPNSFRCGALSGVPHQMVSLLQCLRRGVLLNGSLYKQVLNLNLPMLYWEKVPSQVLTSSEEKINVSKLDENKESKEVVRITEKSYKFWITVKNGSHVIKWDDSDYRTFMKIVRSLDSKVDFNVEFDLSDTRGSLAQVVQTIDHEVDTSIRWYTMVPVDDNSIKLGATFAFSYSNAQLISKFSGSFETAYQRGQITPRRIMSAILF